MGKEWYASPVNTSSKWADSVIIYGENIYTHITNNILPQAFNNYKSTLSVANELALKTQRSLNFIIENPRAITKNTIESATYSLTEAGRLSAEIAFELQIRTFEIIQLLLEQPLETLESAYMSFLTHLLNGYF